MCFVLSNCLIRSHINPYLLLYNHFVFLVGLSVFIYGLYFLLATCFPLNLIQSTSQRTVLVHVLKYFNTTISSRRRVRKYTFITCSPICCISCPLPNVSFGFPCSVSIFFISRYSFISHWYLD